MKKKLVLWLAAAAMLGLSACDDDNSIDNCIKGSTRCAVDGKLESCQNDAWVATACTGNAPVCLAGQCVECLNDSKRCEKNAVQSCVKNVWTETLACGDKVCNPTGYVCEDAPCTEGWQRCTGNSVEVCKADLKFHAADPVACKDGSHCIANAADHTTACVACTDNVHCGDLYKCDIASHKCIASLPKSTITTCTTSSLLDTIQILIGYLDSKIIDNTGITAKALCGKADQAIRDYQSFPAGLHQDAGYWADLSELSAGEYLCILSFQREGEMPVACQKDGKIIGDLREPASTGVGVGYTNTKAWDHVIDFEGCPTTAIASDGNCTSGLSYKAAITPTKNEAIYGQSLRLNAGGSVKMTAPKGVEKLSVTFKKIDTHNAVLNIKVNDVLVDTVPAGTYMPGIAIWSSSTVKVSDSANIVIETTEPIVIDMLKWTDYK